MIVVASECLLDLSDVASTPWYLGMPLRAEDQPCDAGSVGIERPCKVKLLSCSTGRKRSKY
jgi:hypothetical protein